MNIREGCVRDCRKFGLEAGSQQSPGTSERTDLKDVTDLIELQLPGSDRLFVIPRSELSGERVPLASLDDIPLDIGHHPAIEGLVSKSTNVCVTSSTHVVNRSIALRTDWLD